MILFYANMLLFTINKKQMCSQMLMEMKIWFIVMSFLFNNNYKYYE